MPGDDHYRRENDRLLGELSANLVNLTRELREFNERLDEVEAQLNKGKGALAAVMFISGAAGYLAERFLNGFRV